MKLVDKNCLRIKKDSQPLTETKINTFIKQLDSKWEIIANKRLRRSFRFDNYLNGAKFVQNVAELSEKENHHPDIYLFYKVVEIELSTHEVNGLSENDFILAAKVDLLN